LNSSFRGLNSTDRRNMNECDAKSDLPIALHAYRIHRVLY